MVWLANLELIWLWFGWMFRFDWVMVWLADLELIGLWFGWLIGYMAD
jgi:hypothetical protein